MNLALAAYENRIASLFESLDRFIIIDSQSNNLQNSISIPVTDKSPMHLSHLLKTNKVELLICGAISGCIQQMLEAHNVQVIPWITGNLESVIHAYKMGEIFLPQFTMPGCGKRGRHGRRGFFRGK